MNLVIVESPTKVKSVGRYLGRGYTVKASCGHVRDLPVKSIGVDLENGFLPQYEEGRGKGKILSELKTAVRAADVVYLASDPDREGEAIAWHLREVLSKVNRNARFYRVTYNQITKSAVEDAFRHPRDIDMNLVNSQQARRIIDRIVGYKVSPLLWRHEKSGTSAGRVQSVAQRLICDREREIQTFQPEEYWNFDADFQAWNDAGNLAQDLVFHAKLTAMDNLSGDKFVVDNKDFADKILDDVRSVSDWRVAKIEKTPKKRYPFPPFITSTLQQAASNALGFSSSKTMRIAQELYEGVNIGNGSVGLITYMRTDSVAVAPEAQQVTRAFLISKLGQQFVPFKPPVYKSKGNAQEAHEAIRPTDVNNIPKLIAGHLSPDQMKLYDLIWRRFVASQMAPAENILTSVDVVGESAPLRTDGTHSYNFHSTATVTTFPGFLRVYHFKESETGGEGTQQSQVLDKLFVQQRCDMVHVENTQKFTEPKPHFTEASLIHEMEAHGIGRPSTYASIIETILKREYTVKEKGKLLPTPLGFRVTDFLVQNLPELFQVGFTASMEASLDSIGSGDVQWTTMMDDFYQKFCFWLNGAKNAGTPTSEKVCALLNEMQHITEWPEPENTTVDAKRKPKSERSFFESVQKDFKKNGTITGKQWSSLLILALRHEGELPAFRDLARKYAFEADLASAERVHLSRLQKRKDEAKCLAEAETQSWLNSIFASMANIQWNEPVTLRGKKYDDSEIFNSFRTRLENGKPLTDKQLAFFYKIFTVYKSQISDFESLKQIFETNTPNIALKKHPARKKTPVFRKKTGFQPTKKDYDSSAAPARGKDMETGRLISALSSVKVWNAPLKRGGRVYDDGEFFKSVKNQYLGGKDLSVKQIAALQKMAMKYGVSISPAQGRNESEL